MHHGLARRLALTSIALIALAAPAAARPPADTTPEAWTKIRLEKYQLEKKTLGAQGYDPVGYFPEGDPKGKGRAVKGPKDIEHTHLGVIYRFSSRANLELFKKNPEKYEPSFGGWCAYAIAHETYTEPNPKNFKIQGGRLLLFYDDLLTNTAKEWEKEGPLTLEPRADAYWTKQTGERPPEKPTP